MKILTSATKPLSRVLYNYRKRVSLKESGWTPTVGTSAEVRANIDELISFCKGTITDLCMGINNNHDGVATLIGNSSLSYSLTTRIGGLTCWEYILQQAHKNGIRVYAWWSIYSFDKWGAGGFLKNPFPNDADHHDTSNGANIVNYSNATTRQKLVDIIVDWFKYNPGTDGLMLDGIRTDGLATISTAANVSSLVEALRHALRGYIIMIDTPGYVGMLESYKADYQTWVQNGWIDLFIPQGYYSSYIRKQYVCEFSGLNQKSCMYSSGYDQSQNKITEAEFIGVITKIMADNRDWSIFRYDQGVYNFRQHILDALRGSLTVTQLPITKVRMSSTDFSIIVDGIEYTETYANISDHTVDGAVKAHMSALMGFDYPFIHFNRYPTSSDLRINVGDYPTY